MNRYEFEDLISDYIENNLSLSKRKEVEQYLNENPESQLLINEISSNMEKVKSVPQLSVDDNFNQTLKSKLMKKNNQKYFKSSNDKKSFFGFTFNQSLLFTGLTILSVFTTIQLFTDNTQNHSSAGKYYSNESDVLPNTPFLKQEKSKPIVSESNLDSIDVQNKQNRKRGILQKMEFVND